MRPLSLLVVVCVALLSAVAAPGVGATETDQFTLPPRPWDDLGPDMGAMVLAILRTEIGQLNARIDERAQLNPRAAPEPIKEREFVTHIFEQTGVGLPESTIERALRYDSFGGRHRRVPPHHAAVIYLWVRT